LFIRHTWGFGGGSDQVDSAPNQMAGTADKRRLVLTAGKISMLDVFDSSSFAHDPRTQFLNWSLIAHGAFDFAADQRGYTAGVALEYYRDDWVFRAGRFEQPIESNGLALDGRIFAHYGDQFEIEHGYELGGQPGRLRVLTFRNKARMGGFRDAVDAWNAGGRVGVPSVAAVRKEQRKVGFGIGAEQNVTKDIGVFARGSANDGREETYAFTEIERALSGGINLRGGSWGRAEDNIGLAYARNGLSAAHRQYLANGGLGAFIGDGNIRYRAEAIGEAYYSLAVTKSAWLSVDVQRVKNPAYNADRGPARFVGVRMHVEL
jgi:carbohydrate-selective porin OprB